ncbi:MAG: ABC transporter permease [Bacteroidota bacterium]
MLKNYIKTAFRNFTRYKSSFLINVSGLSIGLACSFLIFLWVLDELAVDRYHKDPDEIVQIMEHQVYADGISTIESTPGIIARTLKEEYPEFEYAANYAWPTSFLFTKDAESSRNVGLYVENDIFLILDFELLYGATEHLLTKPNTVVLSRSMAEKYFGDVNPIGETLLFENDTEVTITGVFNDLPAQSTFRFDCLLNYQDWLDINEWASDWGNNGPRSIARLAPNTDMDALNQKINTFIKDRVEESHIEVFVYPFAERYLNGSFENRLPAGGRIEYVRLFLIIALFVLVIACINFMNLSTAKAEKRSREVGIRKSIGATRSSLVGQFMGESMLISFFSLFIAIVLVELSLPVFNDITQKSITLDYTNPTLLLLFLGTALLTGLFSGSYPAFFLSSVQAIQTLKGSLKSSWREAFARKGLVIFQFSLSITLIVCTLIIYRQIQYTQTQHLGYTKENLVSFTLEGEVSEQWGAFYSQLSAIPGIQHISRTAHSFVGRNTNTSKLQWEGKAPGSRILFENFAMDYGLIKTMGIELLEGRTFSEAYGADSSKIIFNEAAIKIMGMEDPIGKTVVLWGDEYEIIGVVKNFHFESFRTELNPMFFRLSPDQGWRVVARIQPEDIANTMAQIETLYTSFNPNYPFEYEFMDDRYANLYRSELRIGALSKYLAFFAVFISCLGLFGLSSFMAEQRAKEIGVRKVLGATLQQLLFLLSKDYTKLVFIAIAISIPVSWYVMQIWMDDYAYSSGIEWWVFVIAGCSALCITWLTVSYQSLKAAIVNPVKSLKTE